MDQRITLPKLLLAAAVKEEQKLHHLDHHRKVTVEVARLEPTLCGRFDAQHRAEAQQRKGVPSRPGLMADKEHPEVDEFGL